jgi:hypothetical protein
MKLQPIINQLAVYLPFATTRFTDQLTIIGASQTGTTVTIETSIDHNLTVGDTIVVTDIVIKIPIISITLNSSDNTITVRTSLDHGLTDSFDFSSNQPKTSKFTPTVTLIDVSESEYNGTFNIINVPNRNVFVAQLVNVPVSPPSNDGYSLRYSFSDYNGVKVVSNIISSAEFEYTVNLSSDTETTNSGLIHTSPRISGAIDLTRAEESYTKQVSGKYWLFVSQGSSVASKNREFLNDSVDMWGSGIDYRQRVLETINVFIFVPTSDQLSGRSGIDSLEDIKLALFKSLIRFRPPSIYNSGSSFALTYNSSQTIVYNTAYIIQQYSFDAAFDITYYDTFIPNVYVPFRNIEGISTINNGEYDWNVDLDVDPDA